MDDRVAGTARSIIPHVARTAPSFLGLHAGTCSAQRTRRLVLFPILLFVLLGAGSLPAAAPTEFAPVQSGHSAMWYDPARDGEGWVLEVLPDDKALLYWFTYDEDGDQRWLQGVGDIVRGAAGDVIDFPELYVTRGAEFGSGFDPDDVQIEVVGEATLTFSGCDHGTFSYAAFGQSQTITIERLSQTMAAGCEPINGVPGQPVKAYAGQSGSWFDESHNGEGYALQWLSRDEALLTWYTYDAEGNQYWLIGVGQYEDGEIVFPNLQSTRGARFGAAFDPEDVDFIDWGSLTMELNCNAGTAHYESELAAFGSGDFELTRLTKLQRPDCPYLAPKLWDLYEITWNEIPIEPGTPMDPNILQADSIADDGTIAARLVSSSPAGGAQLAIWRPQTAKWEVLSRKISADPLFISPVGGAIVTSERSKGLDRPRDVLFWLDGMGWKPLSGVIFDRSFVPRPSQNFSRIVGKGHDIGDELRYPWIWNVEGGQQELPLTDEIPGGTPLTASDGGETVAGVTFRPPPEGSTRPIQIAIRWESGDDPNILHDDLEAELGAAVVCNRDCSIIAGFGQAERGTQHPHSGEAWFWTPTKRFGYLGTLKDAVSTANSYVVSDVTANGSLIVGSYSVESGARGFIWTQRTGLVSIRSLIEQLEIGDDKWETMGAVSVTSSGDRILLQGKSLQSEPGVTRWRAVVLKLKEVKSEG